MITFLPAVSEYAQKAKTPVGKSDKTVFCEHEMMSPE